MIDKLLQSEWIPGRLLDLLFSLSNLNKPRIKRCYSCDTYYPLTIDNCPKCNWRLVTMVVNWDTVGVHSAEIERWILSN